MAGRIIVTAPLEYMGVTKLDVFVDGVSRDVKLERGEKHEFDIFADCEVHGEIKGAFLKSEKIKVSSNNITEISFSRKTGTWKQTLEIKITNVTPLENYVEKAEEKIIYDLIGARGRRMKVYEDRCVITTKVSVSSFITGNVSDGEKTIYYSDVLSVQYKRTNLQLGYLQLETASSAMNNRRDNFFNENTFTFDSNLDAQMEEVQNFVKQKVDEAKKQKNAPVVVSGAISNAEELKKFKELLDMGIITQEEFDAKKKQLLGL